MDLEINTEDIIIIQRMFPSDIQILNKILYNQIYFWIHDLVEDNIFLDNNKKFIKYFKNNQKKLKHLLNINFIEKNIYFILNSNFTKKIFIDYFNKFDIIIDENKIKVIYHILYEDEFIKIKYNYKTTINLYDLVYASAWQKGIWDVIKLFDLILSKDEKFKLILLSPGYDLEGFKQYQIDLKKKYGDKIVILGPINKVEYSKIIKSSLCVLTSKFSETFGCVFAESLYLGTPVIGDINSGAVPEIIGSNNIVNYDNLDQFYEKLMEIKNNRNIINFDLNDKFSFEYNYNLWLKLLGI
jgi:glycogen synthase